MPVFQDQEVVKEDCSAVGLRKGVQGLLTGDWQILHVSTPLTGESLLEMRMAVFMNGYHVDGHYVDENTWLRALRVSHSFTTHEMRDTFFKEQRRS